MFEGELPHRRWEIPLARRRSIDDSLPHHRRCRMVLRHLNFLKYSYMGDLICSAVELPIFFS